MYLGGFARANALEDFIACAKDLRSGYSPRYDWRGGGLLKDNFEEEIKTQHLQNIILLDPVEKSQVNAFLQLADCLYIGAKRCELYRYGVAMNKLFDYMLSARPILCGVEASNDMVGDAGCGITIEPESPSAIVAGNFRLFKEKSPEERGRNGPSMVTNMSSVITITKSLLSSLLMH